MRIESLHLTTSMSRNYTPCLEYLLKYFEGQPVNIVKDEQGEPWFKAHDVAERLGYANPREAIIDHVEEADGRPENVLSGFATKLGRPSTYINESGMYALIFGSKKLEARTVICDSTIYRMG